jgi:hypothetical protein
MHTIEVMRTRPKRLVATSQRSLVATVLVAFLAALCACTPKPALAGQTVRLETGLHPDRLGAPTTIEFGFEIHSTIPGQTPPPVTDFDLQLPAGLGVATSGLGLANCEPAALLARGPEGCPANARVGFGSAMVAVSTESEPVEEEGILDVFVGPPGKEHPEVLFYAEGGSPVFAQLVFPGRLLEGGGPSGERLDTTVPLIPTWPGGADVSVTRMTATIGPLGLSYYRRVRGRLVPFKPRGIVLPRRCPRGGFRFRGDLTFLGGARASATATVPCPR